MKSGFFIRTCLSAAVLSLFLGLPAVAQEVKAPELPAPLQNLAAEGAQIRYLGRQQGMDGWITVKRGQEQYFYVTPDGKAIVMGLLFDDKGKLVTTRQVQTLQGGDSQLLDQLASDKPRSRVSEPGKAENKEFRSPSEKLFASVEQSNWIMFGNQKAPIIYVFADPQCPHCKELMNDLKKAYIDTGKIQVRLVPIGFNDQTVAQSAFLLAAPDAEERWFRHASGDAAALPAKQDMNTQAVQMNLALLQAWKFDVTPLTFYRNSKGEIRIMRGRANDIHSLYKDLAG